MSLVPGAVSTALCSLLIALTVGGAIAQLPRAPSAYPEGAATIEHLLLHFDPESGAAWLPAYRDLVRALPGDVRVTVAVQGAAELEELEQVLAAEGLVRPDVLMVGRALTPWARDRMLAVGNSDLVDLLTPRADRIGDSYAGDVAAAGALADRHGCRTMPMAIAFEGGDIVCGGRRAFVGAGTISSNLDSGDWAAAVRSFGRLLSCEVVVVGKPLPPHNHLDMYLTCLGEQTVVLGDPAAGRALLERIQAEQRNAKLPDFDIWTLESQRAVQSLYEAIGRDLTQRGLLVLRVPILHGEQGGLLTWNNALVERRGEALRVYLPAYGIPLLDDAAIGIYRAAGCRVFPIDVSGIAPSGGTVRCITNVIEWSTPQVSRAPG